MSASVLSREKKEIGRSSKRLNAKAKGSRNERRSIKLLEGQGYRCMKSGASLGDWDIVGIGSCDVVLCQVKSNKWPRLREIFMLEIFVAPSNCRKLIHRWNDGCKIPSVKEYEVREEYWRRLG